jgi:hypothetical protein
MEVVTTQLGTAIIEEAQSLLDTVCIEKTAGGKDGTCIRDLVAELFPQQVTNKGSKIPYCAVTVSTILNRAFTRFGLESPLKNPSALGLKDDGKKLGLRIDKKPAPGAIMIANSGTGSGYHAGLVWSLDEDGKTMNTIEGNTTGYVVVNDCVKKTSPKYGVVFKKRTIKGIPYFVHIEDYLGQDTASLDINIPGVAGFSGFGSVADSCILNLEVDDVMPESADPYFYAEREPIEYLPFAIASIAVGIIGYKYFMGKL